MTALATVTVVSGRHRHLSRQHESLTCGTRTPDLVVVVAMGDPAVRGIVEKGPLRDVAVVLDVPVEGGALPLARARNMGADAAISRGADLLVFLDVDCLAARAMLERYDAAGEVRTARDLLCGPVAYLPPLRGGRTSYDEAALAASRPHPARPAPQPGRNQRAGDLRLFWSLSFALRSECWNTIGGFDECYVGYGAEDTDFAQRAGRAHVGMWWIGGAIAYHQWHPVSDPPVEHLDDIVRNANLFEQRWGWFPMEGWLDEFARRGLAARTASRWEVAGRPSVSRAAQAGRRRHT